MKRLFALAFVLIAFVAVLFAGGTYTTSPSPHRYYIGIMPNSNGTLVAGTVYVSQIVIVNDSSSAITVTVKDAGTDCAGGPCLLAPSSLSVAAKTSYNMDFDNQVAPSGIQGSASDGTNVTIRIHYKTTMTLP